MIDEKKIEEAATYLVKETRSRDEEYYLFMENFKAAVKWAQEEFVKSLWHDASEEPMQNRHIIALSKAQMVVYDFEFTKENKWKKNFQQCKIVRWAYLDDILPKEGGEE